MSIQVIDVVCLPTGVEFVSVHEMSKPLFKVNDCECCVIPLPPQGALFEHMLLEDYDECDDPELDDSPLQQLSAKQLTSFIRMYDQSYSPAAIALSMHIPEYDAYDMCEEYKAAQALLQEGHEDACWAEEEHELECYDDFIIYGEPDYDDSFISADELDELDRTTDWDQYEADKRARIAEANEY